MFATSGERLMRLASSSRIFTRSSGPNAGFTAAQIVLGIVAQDAEQPSELAQQGAERGSTRRVVIAHTIDLPHELEQRGQRLGRVEIILHRRMELRLGGFAACGFGVRQTPQGGIETR